jgi:hypothetical protein
MKEGKPMTDFIDSEGTVRTYPVPARNYLKFDEALEILRIAALKRDNELQSLKQPYTEVAKYLEEQNFPHEVRLSISPKRIYAVITGMPSDVMGFYEGLATGLGRRLLEKAIHRDGVPSVARGGYSESLSWTWERCGANSHTTIGLIVTFPRNGISDALMLPVPRVHTDYEYKFMLREQYNTLTDKDEGGVTA